MSFSVPS